MVTEVFDDVQRYRLACVCAHSIVISDLPYVCITNLLPLSSSFCACVCLAFFNGLFERLEPRVLPARCV